MNNNSGGGVFGFLSNLLGQEDNQQQQEQSSQLPSLPTPPVGGEDLAAWLGFGSASTEEEDLQEVEAVTRTSRKRSFLEDTLSSDLFSGWDTRGADIPTSPLQLPEGWVKPELSDNNQNYQQQGQQQIYQQGRRRSSGSIFFAAFTGNSNQASNSEGFNQILQEEDRLGDDRGPWTTDRIDIEEFIRVTEKRKQPDTCWACVMAGLENGRITEEDIVKEYVKSTINMLCPADQTHINNCQNQRMMRTQHRENELKALGNRYRKRRNREKKKREAILDPISRAVKRSRIGAMKEGSLLVPFHFHVDKQEIRGGYTPMEIQSVTLEALLTMPAPLFSGCVEYINQTRIIRLNQDRTEVSVQAESESYNICITLCVEEALVGDEFVRCSLKNEATVRVVEDMNLRERLHTICRVVNPFSSKRQAASDNDDDDDDEQPFDDDSAGEGPAQNVAEGEGELPPPYFSSSDDSEHDNFRSNSASSSISQMSSNIRQRRTYPSSDGHWRDSKVHHEESEKNVDNFENERNGSQSSDSSGTGRPRRRREKREKREGKREKHHRKSHWRRRKCRIIFFKLMYPMVFIAVAHHMGLIQFPWSPHDIVPDAFKLPSASLIISTNEKLAYDYATNCNHLNRDKVSLNVEACYALGFMTAACGKQGFQFGSDYSMQHVPSSSLGRFFWWMSNGTVLDVDRIHELFMEPQIKSIIVIEDMETVETGRHVLKNDVHKLLKSVLRKETTSTVWDKIRVVFDNTDCNMMHDVLATSIDKDICNRKTSARAEAYRKFAYTMAVQKGDFPQTTKFIDTGDRQHSPLDKTLKLFENPVVFHGFQSNVLSKEEYYKHKEKVKLDATLRPSDMLRDSFPQLASELSEHPHADQHRVLIVGLEGEGKTTTISWLAYYSQIIDYIQPFLTVSSELNEKATKHVTPIGLSKNQEKSGTVFFDTKGLDTYNRNQVHDIMRLVDGQYDRTNTQEWEWNGVDCEREANNFLKSSKYTRYCTDMKLRNQTVQTVVLVTQYVDKRLENKFQMLLGFLEDLKKELLNRGVGLVIAVTHVDKCTFGNACAEKFATDITMAEKDVILLKKKHVLASDLEQFDPARAEVERSVEGTYLEPDVIAALLHRVQQSTLNYVLKHRTGCHPGCAPEQAEGDHHSKSENSYTSFWNLFSFLF
eukprot:m.12826 g.12826  ORF g.12826 m.12826 type:complete len:1162 (-) comp4738_c0_seq1:104-3589(-)